MFQGVREHRDRWSAFLDCTQRVTYSFARIASVSAPEMCFPSTSTIHNACAHAVGPQRTILDFGTPVRHFSRNTLIPGLQEHYVFESTELVWCQFETWNASGMFSKLHSPSFRPLGQLERRLEQNHHKPEVPTQTRLPTLSTSASSKLAS